MRPSLDQTMAAIAATEQKASVLALIASSRELARSSIRAVDGIALSATEALANIQMDDADQQAVLDGVRRQIDDLRAEFVGIAQFHITKLDVTEAEVEGHVDPD